MSAPAALCSYRFVAIVLLLLLSVSAAIAQNNGNGNGWGKGGKPKSPPPDDVLYWKPSGSSTAFTSTNWYDSTTGSSTLVAPTGSSASPYDSLIFDDPNTNSNAKAAP